MLNGSNALANGHLSGTFSLSPSTAAINASPTVTGIGTFSYYDSNTAAGGPQNCATILVTGGAQCEWLKDATISLAPGMLANPAAVATPCTAAQFTAASTVRFGEHLPGGLADRNGFAEREHYDTTNDGASSRPRATSPRRT